MINQQTEFSQSSLTWNAIIIWTSYYDKQKIELSPYFLAS